MILLRSFLSGHIRIKRTLEYYDAGIGPRVPFGGGFGPTVSANFAVALGDFTTLSTTSTMPTGGSISRAGNAMLYDSTGKLTYAPNNLVSVYSDAPSSASTPWSAGGTNPPTITTSTTAFPGYDVIAITFPAASNSTANGVNTSRSGYVGSPISITSNDTRVMQSAFIALSRPLTGSEGVELFLTGSTAVNNSILLTSSTANPTSFIRRSQASTFSVSSATPGLGFFARIANTLTAPVTMYITSFRASLITSETAFRAADDVATTTSAYYGPRFDYDPVTLQPKGLLVEGTRTNLLTYSEQFDNAAWSKGNISVTANNTTSPDGTSSADKIVETNDATAQLHYVNKTSLVNVGSAYALTVYAKAAERTQIAIQLGADIAYYNLSSGTIVSGSGTITAIGNGWYRCGISTASAANSTCAIYTAVSGSATYIGNGTSGVYLFGAQLEQANFASSYIPTVASTVARAAETFSLTGYANRLVEAYYIDEQTGANYSGNSALSTGTVTISPPTFGWVTSLRAYQNAYAGSISTPSWLSFSRAGNAMYYDSTGTLTYAPNNLLLQSNTLSNAVWSKDTGGSIVGGIIDPFGGNTAWQGTRGTTTGNPSYFGQRLLSTDASLAYIYSVWLQIPSGTMSAQLSISDYTTKTVSSNITVTTAWQRFSYAIPAGTLNNTGSIFVGLSGVGLLSGSVINIYGEQLEAVTYQTAPSAYIPTTSAAVYGPRYDYDPSTVPATPRGLLIEESRANLSLYSTTIPGWATQTNISYGTLGVAPDGTSTAQLLRPTTASGIHYVDQAVTYSTATYTYSVFAKASGYNFVRLGMPGYAACFNLSNGTVGATSGSPTASIQSVGNGWYRCIITGAVTGVAGGQPVSINNADSASSLTYTGDGVSGVFVWGAQLEVGSFATSYIPTTTASVTRAADVAQLTGSALTTFQGSNVTAITQYTQNPSFDAGSAYQRMYLWDYTDGGLSRLTCRASDLAGTNPNLAIGNGASVTTIAPTSSVIKGTTNRFGAAFSKTASPAAVSLNGQNTVTGGTVFAGSVTSIYLGCSNASTNQFNSWVGSFALYNQRLPDAILKQKSSVGAPY